MQYPKIQAILRESKFSLSVFNHSEIQPLEEKLTPAKDKKGNSYYVAECLKRGNIIKMTPEEVVRQLFLHRLIYHYKYPKSRITVEYPVRFGTDTSKRADIIITDKDRPDVVYIIVELKKPTFKEGKDQLKSYCNGTGAPIGFGRMAV